MTKNQKKSLPNSSGTLVCGILSLSSVVFCACFYGIGAMIGLLLAIVALAISAKASGILKSSDSDTYRGVGNHKAGRVMAIISLCLSSLWLIFIIIMFIIYGSLFTYYSSDGGFGSPSYYDQINNFDDYGYDDYYEEEAAVEEAPDYDDDYGYGDYGDVYDD